MDNQQARDDKAVEVDDEFELWQWVAERVRDGRGTVPSWYKNPTYELWTCPVDSILPKGSSENATCPHPAGYHEWTEANKWIFSLHWPAKNKPKDDSESCDEAYVAFSVRTMGDLSDDDDCWFIK